MSKLRPLKWLWGLIPLSFIAAMAIFGLGPQIEKELQSRASGALERADVAWASVNLEGRDAILRGAAVGAEARDAGLDAVRGVAGIRNVEDRVTLLESVSPYTWWANRKEGRIRIKGYVADGRDRHTILGIVKAMMPELAIDDRMKRAAGAPPRETWVGSISFALNLLANLKDGTASLVDSRLSLTGEASSAEAYAELRDRLDTQLPVGLELDQIALTPPAAAPFAWGALFESGSVTLSGHVPDDIARAELTKSARELFGDASVIDQMQLASGAPDNWTQVAQTALIQLSRLQTGKAILSDTNLAFEGTASDENTAKDVASKVRLGLPAIYKSTEDVGHETQAEPSGSRQGARAPEARRADNSGAFRQTMRKTASPA
jgi:OOP family OmpA-OmpF porin